MMTVSNSNQNTPPMSHQNSNQSTPPLTPEIVTCISSVSNEKATKQCYSLKTAAEMNHHKCMKKAMKEILNIRDSADCHQSVKGDQYVWSKYARYLYIAVDKENYETVKVLLDLGIKPIMRREYANKNRMSPLHLASRNLSAKLMRLFLEKGADINARDDDNDTCLHYVLKSGNYNDKLICNGIEDVKTKAMECLQLLLKNDYLDIDAENALGRTPLHIAAIQRNDLFVTELIKRGADMYKKTFNEKEETPMRMPSYYITKFCSNSILHCLDDCIKPASDSTYENPKWDLDVSFLANQHKMHVDAENNSNEGVSYRVSIKKRVGRKELARSSMLLKLQRYECGKDIGLKEGARKILDHPVIHTFIRKRWDEIKWIYYILIMMMHFIYSITFTTHSILVYHDICPIPREENYYSTNRTSLANFNFIEDLKKEIPCNITACNETQGRIINYSWICLLVFTFFLFVKDAVNFIDQKWKIFYQIDTWVHFFIAVMACICVSHEKLYNSQTPRKEMTVYKFQHHAAVWGIFATWYQLFLYMGRTPVFGLYINMFQRVAKTFLRLIWAFLSLLAAFTFTFYLLFPSHFAFDNDLPSVFVKIVDMMIGEVDFNELYYPPRMVIQPTKNPNRPFPEIGNNFTIQIQNLSFEKEFEDVQLPLQKLPRFENKSHSFLRKTPKFENINDSFLSKTPHFDVNNSFSGYEEFNQTVNYSKFKGYEEFNQTVKYSEFAGYEKSNQTMKVPVLESKSNFKEYSMPNLFDADVNTSPKPPFLPGTGIILLAIFIYLVPVVMFNLLVGLAIDDVQESKKIATSLQLNQQIRQIHWIDALINAYPFVYRLLRFFKFLKPSKNKKQSVLIVDILHDNNNRDKIETKASKLLSRMDIPLDLRCELDVIYIDAQKAKVGELKEEYRKEQMANTVQQIKRAQERDSQQIKKLSEMVEKLLSYHCEKTDADQATKTMVNVSEKIEEFVKL